MTTYALKQARELIDVEKYIREHGMENDELAREVIADQTATLRQLIVKPVRYVSYRAPKGADQTEAYLGFGARVIETREDGTARGYIAVMPSEHADWFRDRLRSGMYPAEANVFYAAASRWLTNWGLHSPLSPASNLSDKALG